MMKEARGLPSVARSVKEGGRRTVSGRLAATLLLVAAAGAQGRSGLDVAAFDRSVRPQDDLFRHVNGVWLKTVDVPADRVTYGTTAELADKTEADLKAIVDDVIGRRPRTNGTPAQQIADLYLSTIDEATIERLGAAPLQPELARIDAIRTATDLAAEAGRLSSIGAGGPFGGVTGADPLRPATPIVRIVPGGTLLPDRAYYTGTDPAMATVRVKYEAYLRLIFEATSREAPADAAREVLALETAIAQAQWDDSGDAPDGRYTLHELAAAMPGFDWTAWARPQGLDRTPAVILARPAFFKAFAAMVPRVPLRTWRNWLVARYVTAAAPYLSSTFDMARFDFFGAVVTGQIAPRARWKRGTGMLNGFLGDALGRLYVERLFPPSSRARARRLVASIMEAYRDALRETPWMAPSARREAQARLAAMSAGVGYPDQWRDYSGLVIRPDDFFGNWQRALAFENADRLRRVRASTGGLWMQPPQTVGAYYLAATNEIVVPAGILQPPIFDVEADDAVNYGAAGALVAHEIAHAFTDNAGDFDAGPLMAQLNALEPLPGLRVNGRGTAAESFGDLGGLAVAYRAYKASLKGRPSPQIDGLSGEQRFFLAWARMWRAKERPEYVRSTLQTSAHLPATLRANFAVSNMDGFYDAFGVKPGDGLFRAPASRVRVW
jgi:putative endopeptidase